MNYLGSFLNGIEQKFGIFVCIWHRAIQIKLSKNYSIDVTKPWCLSLVNF